MTEDEFTEAFQLIRDNLAPEARPLLDSLERLYMIDRASLEAHKVRGDMAQSLFGHRVYQDNDRHSRRANIRSVS